MMVSPLDGITFRLCEEKNTVIIIDKDRSSALTSSKTHTFSDKISCLCTAEKNCCCLCIWGFYQLLIPNSDSRLPVFHLMSILSPSEKVIRIISKNNISHGG